MKSLKKRATNKVTFLTLCTILLLTFSGLGEVAQAGTVAEYKMIHRQGKKEIQQSTGTYTTSGNWVKVEADRFTQDKKPLSKEEFFVDEDQLKATFLFHPQKKYLNVDFNLARSWEKGHWVKVFRNGGFRVNPRFFEKMGFTAKLLREEKVKNYPCKVWLVKNLKNRTPYLKATIWEAKAPEWNRAPLKMKIEQGNDVTIEVQLANLKQTSVDVATFNPPKDYALYEPKIITSDQAVHEAGQKKGRPALHGKK